MKQDIIDNLHNYYFFYKGFIYDLKSIQYNQTVNDIYIQPILLLPINIAYDPSNAIYTILYTSGINYTDVLINLKQAYPSGHFIKKTPLLEKLYGSI